MGQHRRALHTCRRLRCCLWEACQKQQQALPTSARKTQPCFTLCLFVCPKSLWRPQPEQTILKTAPTLTTAPLNGKGMGWGAEYRFYEQGGLGLNLLHLVRGVPTCFYEKRCVINFTTVCLSFTWSLSNILVSWVILNTTQGRKVLLKDSVASTAGSSQDKTKLH